MQFMNGPQYAGVPMDPYGGNNYYPQQPANNPYGYINQNQVVQNPNAQQRPKMIDPRQFETPEITMGENHKPLFSVVKEDGSGNVITVDNDSDTQVKEKKQKRTPAKKTKDNVESGALIKIDDTEHLTGEVDGGTIYSYGETNALLHETLGQIDAINIELVQEFNAVRHNRTMKNKYMVLNNLSENIGSMISNRISTIKEINNCITKANDMDYKKYKDIQAAQATMNDDKYIADLYQAFISQPQNSAPQYQMPQIDQSILGSGIVRANINQNDLNNPNGGVLDAGYLSYVANLTPEQNAMRYEGNPNIKQVIVYDASTGARFFQMMDVVSGEAIPNMPVYDQMFLEDTTLDLERGIAKNINLNETFPIIQINNNITSQY